MAGVEELRTLARSEGPRGEVVLRRRLDGDGGHVDELIVNGAFAMDSAEISTELALARTVHSRDSHVLVGGLGLGFTTAELLRLGAARVDVVEIEACLVGWARDAVTSTLGAVAADHRVRLRVGDIADLLIAGQPDDTSDDRPGWDAILLDVDNGPDFLIHDANARLYEAGLLGRAAGLLRPGGVLAVWCQGPAPLLATTLADLDGAGAVEEHLIEVVRGDRAMTYAIYTLTRRTQAAVGARFPGHHGS